MSIEPIEPTPRTTLRRRRDRGDYDRATVNAILDEGLVCHVGFATDNRPWVVPMIHSRRDAELCLHGAVGNHLLRALSDGVEACATVTLIDGLVLARSAFNHSINYRSVMVFGTARLLTEPDKKREVLHDFVAHVLPGRAGDCRPPTARELDQTLVITLPITEASAKVRTGGPSDDDEDLDQGYWAGVLPLELKSGVPVPDDDLPADVPTPGYVTAPRRPGMPGSASA